LENSKAENVTAILSLSIALNFQVLPLGKAHNSYFPDSGASRWRFECRSNSKKRLSDLKRKETEGKNGLTVSIVLTNIATRSLRSERLLKRSSTLRGRSRRAFVTQHNDVCALDARAYIPLSGDLLSIRSSRQLKGSDGGDRSPLQIACSQKAVAIGTSHTFTIALWPKDHIPPLKEVAPRKPWI
jgi:hypothetical protein